MSYRSAESMLSDIVEQKEVIRHIVEESTDEELTNIIQAMGRCWTNEKAINGFAQDILAAYKKMLLAQELAFLNYFAQIQFTMMALYFFIYFHFKAHPSWLYFGCVFIISFFVAISNCILKKEEFDD